ncbi:MAG TPA: hypothetical protein DCR24_13585 [Bacillus bacterium]|nr:hypothetical protein [Bacillus sp. (in: firmicutes)]
MRKGYQKIFYGFLSSQLLVLVISLIYHNDISLLNYINISFYISSILLFTSLLVFTVNSGFFDAMSYSFRSVFSSAENGEKKRKIEEMTPLSEMIAIDTNPLIAVGLFDFILMLAGLFIYYQ